jgi:hypothetical protein
MPSGTTLDLWKNAYVSDVESTAISPRSDRASVIFVGIVA